MNGTITSVKAREKIINDFQTNDKIKILLVTTQTGGVGLNLTAANRIILIEPTWNPGNDAQAIDRACRIGQSQHVLVYRIVTCGTVEEKIYRRQVFKNGLVKFATNEDKDPKKYFTNEELKELMTLSSTTKSETCEKMHEIHGNPIEDHPEVQKLIKEGARSVSDHDRLFCVSENSSEPTEENPFSHEKDMSFLTSASEFSHEMKINLKRDSPLTKEFKVEDFLDELNQTINSDNIDDDAELESYVEKNFVKTVDLTEEISDPKCHHSTQSEAHGYVITRCRCDALSTDVEKYNSALNLARANNSKPEICLGYYLDALDIFDDDISIQIEARKTAKILGVDSPLLVLSDYIDEGPY